MLQISDLRRKRKCTIRVAKTKALISFAVTAKLICVFVFAYADCWFSHGAAHLMNIVSCKIPKSNIMNAKQYVIVYLIGGIPLPKLATNGIINDKHYSHGK